MPSPTFGNLPERKRLAVLEAALDEFAGHDYEVASVSRIVATLGIAKGSVYQYFADKGDLYLHLVEWAQATMLTALQQMSAEGSEELGFFDALRAQMHHTVLLAHRFPRQSRLLERAYRSPAPVVSEVLDHGRAARTRHLLHMVERAQQRGELDPAADTALLALVLEGVVAQIGPFLDERLPDTGPERYDVPLVAETFDGVIDLLRRGLEPQRGQPS